MSLTGYLSEYSLVEIFNFVQEGNKTGLLAIDPDRCLSRSLDNSYYISFQFGRIVAVTNGHGLQDRGLLRTIEQRRWLSLEQITGLSFHAIKLQQPLGTYLKSCNLLDAEQLKLLFDAQVTANICKLFGEYHHGRFNFAQIAERLMLGIDRVQQIGFRLSAIGLVDEVSIAPALPPQQIVDVPTPISAGIGNAHAPVSVSFLSRLVGFLKKG